MKNKTIRGGYITNPKIILTVSESMANPENSSGDRNLQSNLHMYRTIFPLSGYIEDSMNRVDEAFGLINLNSEGPEIVYKETIEYGYNDMGKRDEKPKGNKTKKRLASTQLVKKLVPNRRRKP
jgi:hypothetical protein